MKVRACSTYTTRGGQMARIQEVIKHPGWSVRSSPDNDVALGLLDRMIKFSHSCHNVDLPNHAMFPPFGDVWVAGWGCTRPDGIAEPLLGISLQVYYARLINRAKCDAMIARFGIKMTPNFICVEQAGKRAPCTRDTGAPAVSDGVLWGLASWGIRKKCGTERYPAMFSYVGSPSNLFFITNATLYLMSEKRMYPFLDKFRGSDGQILQQLRATNLSRLGPGSLKQSTVQPGGGPEIIKVEVDENTNSPMDLTRLRKQFQFI